MKILAILGSPHKGNTFRITQDIESILTKHPDVEFEYLHLKDLDLKPCRGCYLCFHKGAEKCPIKDDKQKVDRKLDNADGIILVSPVYSMQVTYLMKLFIDRYSYHFHRPAFFGKYAMVVAASGNPGLGLRNTLKYMKMVAYTLGFELAGELGYVAPPQNMGLPKLSAKEVKTSEAVKKFYLAIKEKKPRKLTIGDYLSFYSYRTTYQVIGEEIVPTEYNYFKEKGWFEKGSRYFHDHVRHSFIKEIPAKLVSKMMQKQISRTIQTSV
jgi:multimeric flavodoxin WrbA